MNLATKYIPTGRGSKQEWDHSRFGGENWYYGVSNVFHYKACMCSTRKKQKKRVQHWLRYIK